MLKDARGLALAATDSVDLESLERSLVALRTYRGDPVAPLDEALARNPGFASAHIAKALILMTFFERRFARDARDALAAGADAIATATPRERALASAAANLAAGDWHAGVAALDRVLVEHPRDILALQVAHLVDFNRGDALNLRNRISRALPEWSSSIPGYSYVLGMHSFGLEECNQYPEAEAAGMRALEAAADDCWAVHAVTHVMEMQGRVAEGIRFLEDRTRDWATDDNGFAFHNWWHLALFHIDRGDLNAAIGIYDRVLGSAHALAMSRLDATSLLWRLHLEGADVSKRFEAVADSWSGALEAEGGYYAFYDFHAAMAFAAAGREDAARRVRAALEKAAWEESPNGEMSRGVGIDVAEAVLAFAEKKYARAAEKLLGVRDVASRFGGSHAQRDVLQLTRAAAIQRAAYRRAA